MAVKVLIERRVKRGHEEIVWQMLRELRGQAVRQRGYLYGETWRSMDEPAVFMVSSTWGCREYWDAWVNDEFRRRIENRIRPYLRREVAIRVFEEVSTLPDHDA